MRNLLFWATLALYLGGPVPAQSIKYIGRHTNELMLGELAEQDMYRPVGLIVSVLSIEGRLRGNGEMDRYDTISTGTGTLVRKKSDDQTSRHILTSRHVLELGPHVLQDSSLQERFSSFTLRILSQSFYIGNTWYSIEAHSMEHPIACVARLGRHVPNILPARIGRITNNELLKRLTGGTKDESDWASTLYLTETLKTPLPHSLTLCGFGIPQEMKLDLGIFDRLSGGTSDVRYPPTAPPAEAQEDQLAAQAATALSLKAEDSPVTLPEVTDAKANTAAAAAADSNSSPFRFRKVDGAALRAAEAQLTQGPFSDARSHGLKNHRKRACMLYATPPAKMPKGSHDNWVISSLFPVAFVIRSQFHNDFFATQQSGAHNSEWSLYGVPTEGDSGAPLFYQNAQSDKGPFVIGIHEFSSWRDQEDVYNLGKPELHPFTGSVTFNGEDVEKTGIWPKGF